jgi:hypothetical protein
MRVAKIGQAVLKHKDIMYRWQCFETQRHYVQMLVFSNTEDIMYRWQCFETLILFTSVLTL